MRPQAPPPGYHPPQGAQSRATQQTPSPGYAVPQALIRPGNQHPVPGSLNPETHLSRTAAPPAPAPGALRPNPPAPRAPPPGYHGYSGGPRGPPPGSRPSTTGPAVPQPRNPAPQAQPADAGGSVVDPRNQMQLQPQAANGRPGQVPRQQVPPQQVHRQQAFPQQSSPTSAVRPPPPFQSTAVPPGSYPPQTLPPPTSEMGQLSVSSRLPGPPPVSPSFQTNPLLPGGGPPPPPPWQQQHVPARRVYPTAYGAGPRPLVPPPTGAFPPQAGAPANIVPPPFPSSTSQLSPPVPTPSPGSRIDPNQIPRPQPAPANQALRFETRTNGAANLPPSATSHYLVKDTGNCSPRFMRSTMNQIPCTADLLNTSSMPLALMVQPMALQDPSEEPLQVVDFKEVGPVRCSRCKAYINPFMKFVDQGRKFICNLCGSTNETPHDYICNLGPDGRSRDADDRPELSRGSIEFVAPKEYMVRDPMPNVFFFLVDVSLNAVSTGATATACTAIQRALSDIPASDSTFVGFATFNSNIQFYSLNPRLAQPSMLVVPDIQDVYTPLPSDLVVKLSDAKERLEQLLESIPGMFQSTRVADSAFVAALNAAYLAIKSTGGKILAFQSVLPSVGIGSLSSREAEGRSNTNFIDKDLLKLLQPADKSLKSMAMDFADFQVCVDVFVTSQGFVDVASIATFTRSTGGELYSYFPFNAQFDNAKLYNDLRWNLIRPVGMEAVMKVRCSSGLTVDDYFGNFHRRLPAEIYLPSCDCDKSIMVTFKHDDKLPEPHEACFQSAILYTSSSGERRVRVHTLSLPTTTVLSNLFRAADLDAQFAYMVKHAVSESSHVPLQTVRDKLISHTVSVLYTYRKFCASASSSGQLILPEALKLLPLYALALNKSAGLRNDCKLDQRSYWLSRAHFLSTSLIVPLVYPRMFAIHTLLQQQQQDDSVMQFSDPSKLPVSVGLSSEKVDPDGIFLLENGEDAYICFSRGTSPELVNQLLGLQSVDEIKPGPFVLQEFDNPPSKTLNSLLNTIRAQRCSYLRLRLLKRGDPSENLFFQYLVEDRGQSGMSYVEFLVYVHRQIQNKMS